MKIFIKMFVCLGSIYIAKGLGNYDITSYIMGGIAMFIMGLLDYSELKKNK